MVFSGSNVDRTTTIEEDLTTWVRGAFVAAFPGENWTAPLMEVVATVESRHGDYQWNGAMSLAKILKQAPRTIAETVAAKSVPPESVKRLEVAGPGFLNFHLKDSWLVLRLASTDADRERLGVPASGGGKTVVIDYSSPNIAKQMHIAHIRSTVIGSALDQMYRFLGYHVISDNHLGDWGTQFGILIKGFRDLLDEEGLREDPIVELERIYVTSSKKGEDEASWKDAARQELVKLQAGDPENRALWERILEISWKEFCAIYERLNVSFDLVRGESYYNDELPGLIEWLVEQGIARESEGALVVHLEEEELPVCIVRKSDGAANYATTDLATIQSRVEEFNPDSILYLTDEAQQNHFRQVFAVARRMGVSVAMKHIWFGRMRMEDGGIATRSGNAIKLHVLLDEGENRALDLVRSLNPDMPEHEQKKVARSVGMGAIKYADLSQNRQSGIVFTWEKALAMEGNSGPYLQYACARIASVQAKFREQFPSADLERFPFLLGEPVERELALHLLRFPEVMQRAVDQCKPNLLTDYLYNLAQVYSSFYQNLPFLKAEEGIRESRIRLCGLVAAVLEKGLHLLGIETPARI